jgi:hypothetical protein
MSPSNPESSPRLSQKEIDKIRCDELSKQLHNPYAGEIFRSAIICFDRFSVLKDVKISIHPESSIYAGGYNGNGELEIYLGTAEGSINERMKSRIIERFGLPEGQDFPDGIYKLFIFAHEIGHVVQKDEKFKEFYGDYDDSILDPNTDYKAYVTSENEVLADYIAAQIISNTEFGRVLGIDPPKEEPKEWRKWGEKNNINNTISKFYDQSGN